MSDQQLHAIIEGHVQGVGFRYFVLETAQQLNLTGWVRNLGNGNVELRAEGNRTDLDALYADLQKGNSGSFITKIDVEWLPAENVFTMFSIKPSSD
jgi:acylphosphatase